MRRFLPHILPRTVALATASAVAATVALAWFSASGSGAGQAAVTTSQTVTITALTPSTGLLYPGSDGQVDATVTNPSSVPAHISALLLDTSVGTGGFAADAAHSACNVSSLSYTTQRAGWTVPARVGTTNGTLVVHLPGAIHMAGSAVDACQGATFTVGLSAGS